MGDNIITIVCKAKKKTVYDVLIVVVACTPRV